MSLGQRTPKVEPTITSTASAPPTPIATMPEAAGVGRVAVGADHHPAREGVLLEHDLVDDAAARLPEADAVLGRHRLRGSRRPRG